MQVEKYHLGRKWGWRWSGQGQSQAGGGASPLLSGHCLPIRDGAGSQGDGAEDLRVWSELALFPLSVCSPPPNTGTLAPKIGVLDSRQGNRLCQAS